MRGEEYKLFWPQQPEFVRMAARFGATIVPFGGVGLDDGFEMLLDPREIRSIPVLGKYLEDNAKKKIPPARRCAICACQRYGAALLHAGKCTAQHSIA